MLSQSPKISLRTFKPTPTTVSYTVSARAHSDTIAIKILHNISLVPRIVTALAIITLFFAKWRLIFPLPTHARPRIETLILSNAAGDLALRAAQQIDWRILIPSGLLGLWMAVRRGYTEESLLVLRGLGVQTSTTSATYLSSGGTRFIPATSIQDVFIHEAFKGFEVRYYLCIVVKGEEDVVVVFPRLLPRRAIVEDVWRGARACLYERKS